MTIRKNHWLKLATLCLATLGTAGGAHAQATTSAQSTTDAQPTADAPSTTGTEASSQAAGPDVPGLISTPVGGPVHEVAGRFANAARISGMTVFARIDHRQGAMSRSLALLPTEVIIFGNPKGGTPLLQCAQTAGIDLPMKALVWQDDDGQTWLGYNDPAWIAERHGVSGCDAVKPLQQNLEQLVKETTTTSAD